MNKIKILFLCSFVCVCVCVCMCVYLCGLYNLKYQLHHVPKFDILIEANTKEILKLQGGRAKDTNMGWVGG